MVWESDRCPEILRQSDQQVEDGSQAFGVNSWKARVGGESASAHVLGKTSSCWEHDSVTAPALYSLVTP